MSNDAVAKTGDHTSARHSIARILSRRLGHRGRNATLGAAVGAGLSLGIGRAVDNDCSKNSIVCTGNRGRALATHVLGILGAAIGAVLPTLRPARPE